MKKTMTTLVLGIGNTLLMDDGVGIHVVDYLRNRHGDLPGVVYMDGGTLSFTLAEAIEGAEALIVVDAAEFGPEPGAVRSWVGPDMDGFIGTRKTSVHEIGLRDLMDIVRLTGCLPPNRALVGVQPHQIEWGDALSPAAAEAVPAAARQVVELLALWKKGGDTGTSGYSKRNCSRLP